MASTPALRLARADIGEGARFADYLDQASHGLVRVLFGRRYQTIIARAFLTPGHDLSHTTAVFAVIDGRIVGVASAYSAAEHRASSEWPVVRAAGPRVLRMGPMGILGYGMLSFINTGDAGGGDVTVADVPPRPARRSRSVRRPRSRVSATGCRAPSRSCA